MIRVVFCLVFSCAACCAGVGPAAFSGFSVSPGISAAGGPATISIQAADAATVQSVTVQVRYPDGDETDTPLSSAGGGAWSGSVTVLRNFSPFDQALQAIFSSRNAAGAWSRSDAFSITLPGAGAAAPVLQFTKVPAIGDSSPVSAATLHAPAGTVFAMNAFVPDLGFFSKPTCSGGLVQPVPLSAAGTVTAPYATGGIDPLATMIIGYLFPAGTPAIPCASFQDSIPFSFSGNAIAQATRVRTPAAPLSFAGRQWALKAPGVRVGPGGNFFSAANAFPDEQGMHLKIAQCATGDANPYCGGEVYLPQPTGYGTYTFTLGGPLSSLSPNDVFGAYLYGASPGYAHHEIDFELWRQSGDAFAAQFVVAPYTANPPHRFALPAGLTEATVSIAWSPAQIVFTMWQGIASAPTPGTQIEQWTYTRTTSASDVPPNGDQVVHLNMWAQNPMSASAADAAEIVVQSFSFKPSQPSIPPSGVASAASYEGGAVAPGEILAIFGNGLGPAALVLAAPDSSGRYPTSAGGTQILFDGKPAPLLYASDGQAGAVAPFELSGQAFTSVQVAYGGAVSDPVRLAVVPVKPAMFTIDQSGGGQAAIINADGSVNSAGHPAARGAYVSIYGTGGGVTNPAGSTGQITPAILSALGQPASVSVGGTTAVVTYSGGAPAEVAGVFQMNVTIPANAPAGSAIPLIVSLGPWAAQINSTIAIQ